MERGKAERESADVSAALKSTARVGQLGGLDRQRPGVRAVVLLLLVGRVVVSGGGEGAEIHIS